MQTLPHSIEQTGNRTSRATIRDGSIHIRLARNLSSKEEARHIEVLLKRMTKAFLKEQTRKKIDPFAGLPPADQRLLWKRLAQSVEASVSALVRSINKKTIRANITNVTLKFMRSRWGSCGRRGQIALSTPLLFTSPEILRYVIIHELAHIPHPNHSKAFWRTVEQHMPDYREKINELRQCRLP